MKTRHDRDVGAHLGDELVERAVLPLRAMLPDQIVADDQPDERAFTSTPWGAWREIRHEEKRRSFRLGQAQR
jgi:hypothetical protein